MAAIEHALTPEERFLVHSMIASLSPEDREAWLDKLLEVSATDGAAILRDAVNELTTQEISIEELDGNNADPSDTAADEDDAQALDDDAQALDDDAQALALDGDAQALALFDRAQELDEGEGEDSDAPDAGDRANTSAAVEPSRTTSGSGAAPQSSTALPAPSAAPSSGLPVLDPDTLAHFQAIEDALTFAERMRAHELAAQRPPAELRAWFSALAQLPVTDAVAKIRAALAATDDTSRKVTTGGES
jgi:hypothetical protein